MMPMLVYELGDELSRETSSCCQEHLLGENVYKVPGHESGWGRELKF